MNAINFLISEHQRFRKTFIEISDSSHQEASKRKMFDALCQDLLQHETMEQTVWYPILQKDTKLSEIIEHLLSEEKSAAKKIKQMTSINNYEEWKKQFNEFKKDVEHHASEEERKLFPKVKQLLDEKQLDKIGQVMRDFKNNLDLAA